MLPVVRVPRLTNLLRASALSLVLNPVVQYAGERAGDVKHSVAATDKLLAAGFSSSRRF